MSLGDFVLDPSESTSCLWKRTDRKDFSRPRTVTNPNSNTEIHFTVEFPSIWNVLYPWNNALVGVHIGASTVSLQ